MKITDIRIKTFRTYADRWDVGHAQPIPKAELMQTVLAIETDDGVSGYYFGGGSHGDAEGLNVVDQQLISGRIKSLLVGPGPARPRDDLEVALGCELSRERGERHRQRALGPRRPCLQRAGLQADGRRPRQAQGLRLDLSQHRRAARLRRARARLQGRGLPRLQDPPPLLLEPRDAAAHPGPPFQHQGRHRDHPPRPRGGRARLRADVRPLGHLHVDRGGHQGRPRTREGSTTTGTSTRCPSTASRATSGSAAS